MTRDAVTARSLSVVHGEYAGTAGKNGTKPHSDSELAETVAQLNREYAVILLGDRAAILQEDGGTGDADAPPVRFLTVPAFKEWKRPDTILVGGKPHPIANLWLSSEERRQYSGLTFAPTRETPGLYNLWRGWAFEPQPCNGRSLRLLDHVYENVCNGSEPLFDYVIGWFASIFQKPFSKTGTSLALRGEQGVGKTIVGKSVGALLGRHYKPVAEGRYVTSRFNSHLADTLLLQVDEGFWAGDHAAAGKLKDLITSEQLAIEFKGKEPVWVRNLIRLFITSNHTWVVPAALDERRFAVLDVAPSKEQDADYFGKIESELATGGYSYLLGYLLDFDLSTVALHRIPHTEALFEQKLAGLTSEQAWWLDVLHRGRLPSVGLHEAYIEHAKASGVNRRSIETQLSIRLRRMVPNLEKVRRIVEDPISGTQQRVYRYVFPSLAACRAQFETETGTRIEWPRTRGEDPQEWAGGDECPT